MNYEQIFQFALNAIASGGATGLVYLVAKSGIENKIKNNFDNHLELYKSELNREVESLKSTLKNSEVFFVKQLDALNKFNSIKRILSPEIRFHEYDFSHAEEDAVFSFGKFRDELERFLCEFGAYLPNDIEQSISNLITEATYGKLNVDESMANGKDISEKELNSAGNMLMEMTSIRDDFQRYIERKIGEK